jgi:hypothetical protein
MGEIDFEAPFRFIRFFLKRYPYRKHHSACTWGIDPKKISGVGTIFWLLVHVIPGPIKQRTPKPRTLLS